MHELRILHLPLPLTIMSLGMGAVLNERQFVWLFWYPFIRNHYTSWHNKLNTSIKIYFSFFKHVYNIARINHKETILNDPQSSKNRVACQDRKCKEIKTKDFQWFNHCIVSLFGYPLSWEYLHFEKHVKLDLH